MQSCNLPPSHSDHGHIMRNSVYPRSNERNSVTLAEEPRIELGTLTGYALAGRCITSLPLFLLSGRDDGSRTRNSGFTILHDTISPRRRSRWFPAMDSNHYLSAFKVRRPDQPAKRGSQAQPYVGSSPWTRTTIFPHSECGGRTCQLSEDRDWCLLQESNPHFTLTKGASYH